MRRTPGFTYDITSQPTYGNLLVWDGSLAASTAYAPTFSQATPDSWYDAAAVVVVAT